MSVLTTTTEVMVASHPQVGLYFKSYPDFDIAELYEQHQRLIGRFREHKHVEPVPDDPSLLGVAKYIDNLLVRIDEDELLDLEDSRGIWRY